MDDPTYTFLPDTKPPQAPMRHTPCKTSVHLNKHSRRQVPTQTLKNTVRHTNLPKKNPALRVGYTRHTREYTFRLRDTPQHLLNRLSQESRKGVQHRQAERRTGRPRVDVGPHRWRTRPYSHRDPGIQAQTWVPIRAEQSSRSLQMHRREDGRTRTQIHIPRHKL